VVAGASPSTVALVPVTEVATDPPWYTSYPVTPTLSVDALHERLTLDEVVPVTARPPGALGAVGSDWPVHEPPLTVQLAGLPPPETRKPNAAEAPAASGAL
jgi:hypothetical protein